MKRFLKAILLAAIALGLSQGAWAQDAAKGQDKLKEMKAGDALKMGETAYEVVSTSDDTAVLRVPDADGETASPAYFLFVRGKLIPADKKDLMNLGGIDRTALFTFLRDSRTKWDDPQSLQALADFLASKLK